MNVWNVTHWRVGGLQFKGQGKETWVICLTCLPSFFIIRISGCWHWKGAQRSSRVRLPPWALKALFLVICRAMTRGVLPQGSTLGLWARQAITRGAGYPECSPSFNVHDCPLSPCLFVPRSGPPLSLDFFFSLWISEVPWNPSSPFRYILVHFFALFRF